MGASRSTEGEFPHIVAVSTGPALVDRALVRPDQHRDAGMGCVDNRRGRGLALLLLRSRPVSAFVVSRQVAVRRGPAHPVVAGEERALAERPERVSSGAADVLRRVRRNATRTFGLCRRLYAQRGSERQVPTRRAAEKAGGPSIADALFVQPRQGVFDVLLQSDASQSAAGQMVAPAVTALAAYNGPRHQVAAAGEVVRPTRPAVPRCPAAAPHRGRRPPAACPWRWSAA